MKDSIFSKLIYLVPFYSQNRIWNIFKSNTKMFLVESECYPCACTCISIPGPLSSWYFVKSTEKRLGSHERGGFVFEQKDSIDMGARPTLWTLLYWDHLSFALLAYSVNIVNIKMLIKQCPHERNPWLVVWITKLNM